MSDMNGILVIVVIVAVGVMFFIGVVGDPLPKKYRIVQVHNGETFRYQIQVSNLGLIWLVPRWIDLETSHFASLIEAEAALLLFRLKKTTHNVISK